MAAPGKKTKGHASSAIIKTVCQTRPELWIALNKQFCLQPSLECRQRWLRSDIGRQTVPHAVGVKWLRLRVKSLKVRG